MKTVLLGLTGAVFCGVFVSVLNPVKLSTEHLRFGHLDAARTPCTPSPLFIEIGASRSEQQIEKLHAAVVDIPKVADLSHASPDTWHTLPPPVEVYDQHPPAVPAPNEVEVQAPPSAASQLAAVRLR